MVKIKVFVAVVIELIINWCYYDKAYITSQELSGGDKFIIFGKKFEKLFC